MKHIEIDEELYHYLASNTQFIGESASSILRRLLSFPNENNNNEMITPELITTSFTQGTTTSFESKPVNSNVFNYINKEELAIQRGAVGRFLLILSALYRIHTEEFAVVLSIRGRGRLYFAGSEHELAQSGVSTKPRQIPESPYWVITNSNTTRKKMMLTEVSKALGYNQQQIEEIRDLL